MNKKGFFGVMAIMFVILMIILVGMLIWFGFRISAGMVAVMEFLKSYWWIVMITLILVLYRNFIIPVLKSISKKVGL